MHSRIWIAGIALSFALLALNSPASASVSDDAEAEFALLGPRMDSGLVWQVRHNEDVAICALTEQQVRSRVAGKSPAVKQAALDIWQQARSRCTDKNYDYFTGLHASVGIGGQFDINSSMTTQSIGSAGLLDPVNFENRKVGLGASGLVGQFGIGYDWSTAIVPGWQRPPGTRADGFVGVNFDATFGGASKSIDGIPGIVPFLTPAVANTDTLKVSNDVTLDFTGRIGTRVGQGNAAYALGGLSFASVDLKYDCRGFCAVMPATMPFSNGTTGWTYGGVLGLGFETRVDWPRSIGAGAPTLYIEYRAHVMAPLTLDVGSIVTRSTSQQVDLNYQTLIFGSRFRF